MNILQKIRYKVFSQNEQIEILVKEFFRKTIHLLSATIPLFAKHFFLQTIITLSLITILYIIFEFLRIKGKKIFLISAITKFAARKRDNGKFVLGPVTLSLGIIITLLSFPTTPANIGIFALAFGDGLASLAGKCFGKHQLKLIPHKTAEGCLTCFLAVFISTIFITKNLTQSLFIAIIATVVEALPLKNYDNILIPIICAAVGYLII